MTLNPIGASSPCDTWSLSSRRYFTSIFLGYNTEISYLRATTNDGIDFERGYSIPSDQNVTISFATDKQLVGLNGYSSNKLLSSLGFIKLINCDNSTYVSDVSAQNDQKVDIAGIVIPVNEKGTGWSGTLTAVAVSVYLFGFILGLTSFSLTKSLFLRMRSKTTHNLTTGGQ